MPKIDTANIEAYEEVKEDLGADVFETIQSAITYIEKHFDIEDPVKDPNTLALMLVELTAYYESLSTWIAKQRRLVNQLRDNLEYERAESFMNAVTKYALSIGVATQQAKLECKEINENITKERYLLDLVEGLKKSIGRYHDSVRSQLSYEKQQEMFNRGGQ